jgi:drug/metabolite transporter (DMT)-like permease
LKSNSLANAGVEKEDSPPIAVFFTVLSGICFAFNLICGKLLYSSHPNLSPTQLLCYRAILSCGMLIIMVNRKLKFVMVDSIDKEQVKPVILRTCQSVLSISINFISVKFFTLTTVAMVINMAPFVTVLVARIVLGERISPS